MEAKHIEDYIAYLTHEKGLSNRTITEYHRDLSQYIFWCADSGVYPLTATPNDARQFIRKLSAEGKAKTSLARYISALKSFYRWAMMDGHAAQDAAYYLSSPRLPERLPVYLTEGECALLLSSVAEGNTITDVQRRVVIKILYYCGLRAQELTTLQSAQIEKQADGEPVRMKVVGKRNKERTLPIPEPMRKDLSEWLEHRKNLKDWNYARNYKRTAEYIHSKLLLPSPTGGELNYKAIEKAVKGACKKAGIEKAITPHKLRHTYATNLLRRGVPLPVISQALGHASIATTQIYVHIERKEMEDHIHSTHIKPELNN
jgi:integrase/recombinase XerD